VIPGASFERDPNYMPVKIYRKRINVSEIKFLAALAANPGGPGHSDLYGGHRRERPGHPLAYLRGYGIPWYTPGFQSQ
jgi:hypothetical protein